jgi:hypothetical protein
MRSKDAINHVSTETSFTISFPHRINRLSAETSYHAKSSTTSADTFSPVRIFYFIPVSRVE